MSKKRRTKKDKVNPKRNLSVSWKPTKSEAKISVSEANVKRQFSNDKIEAKSKNRKDKFTKYTGENTSLASVKKDLYKGLIFATLIIASEIVIYLIWK